MIDAPALTTKERRYVQFRIDGADKATAARRAGFGEAPARRAAELIETPEIVALVASAQQELTAYAYENSLIDAREIHEYLTDALRARVTDVMNDDGSFKLLSEWPPIWQQMWEKGDVEIESLSERSDDGATKDKRGGWDNIGTVTKIKMGFTSRKDLLKLAMMHSGIRAMAPVKQEVDVNLNVEVNRRLSAALEREAALKVIDVKPE